MPITDHDNWPAVEVIAGHRSQPQAEFSSRQMKNPRGVLLPDAPPDRPQHRVHVFTRVLALQTAHPMRREAAPAGPPMSVREPLAELAATGETVLLRQAGRGRPRAHRMLTETSPVQDKLTEILVSPAAPPDADMGNTQKPLPAPQLTSGNGQHTR